MRHAARRPGRCGRRWHGDGHGAALRHLRPAADLRAAGVHRPSPRDLPRPGLHGCGAAIVVAPVILLMDRRSRVFVKQHDNRQQGDQQRRDRRATTGDTPPERPFSSRRLPFGASSARPYTSRLNNLVHEPPARRRPRLHPRVGRHRQHRIPRHRGRHRREAGRHVVLVTADRRQLQRLERRPPAPVRLGRPTASTGPPTTARPAPTSRSASTSGCRASGTTSATATTRRSGQFPANKSRVDDCVLPRPEGEVRHVQRLRPAGLQQPRLDLLPGRVRVRQPRRARRRPATRRGSQGTRRARRREDGA